MVEELVDLMPSRSRAPLNSTDRRHRTQAMSVVALQLEPFAEAHERLLTKWLEEPQVRPWYPEPAEHVSWARHPPEGGSRSLILHMGRAVAYILIGERSSVAKGLGPAARRLTGR